MKKRTGFVSNSSSASFVISRGKITEDQAAKVIFYQRYMENYNPDWDYWEVWVDSLEITGETSMDNINMEEYLESLGIDRKISHYRYGGD